MELSACRLRLGGQELQVQTPASQARTVSFSISLSQPSLSRDPFLLFFKYVVAVSQDQSNQLATFFWLSELIWMHKIHCREFIILRWNTVCQPLKWKRSVCPDSVPPRRIWLSGRIGRQTRRSSQCRPAWPKTSSALGAETYIRVWRRSKQSNYLGRGEPSHFFSFRTAWQIIVG